MYFSTGISTAWIAVLFGLVGLLFGSFGTVLLARVPRQETIMGRSRCPFCKKILSFLEMIPVISFVVLRGECSACRKGISFQYPLVEMASGLLFTASFHLADRNVIAGALLSICLWMLLLIAIVDAATRSVPDAFMIAFVLSALLYRVFQESMSPWGPVLGFSFFGLQWALSRGRWVGSADVWIAGGIGILLSTWESTLVSIVAAYVVGAIVVSGLLLAGKAKRGDKIAFGPFLAAGALITLIFKWDLSFWMV